MRSRWVLEHAPEVEFAEGDDVIEAVVAYRPNEALGVRIQVWASRLPENLGGSGLGPGRRSKTAPAFDGALESVGTSLRCVTSFKGSPRCMPCRWPSESVED